MGALNLRLPDSVHRQVREIARQEGVSINLFIASAVSEKVSALTTRDYLMSRANQARDGAFGKVLDCVPQRAPIPGDEI